MRPQSRPCTAAAGIAPPSSSSCKLGKCTRPHQHGVDGRDHEQSEQRAEQQPADHHPADRLTRFRARAAARAPAAARRAPSRRSSSGSAAAAASPPRSTASNFSIPRVRSWLANSTIRMPCLVIRPTSITRPILTVHVERTAVAELGVDPHGQQRARHRQRHREHDDERADEALELRRQHQVDEHQREARTSPTAARSTRETRARCPSRSVRVSAAELGFRRARRYASAPRPGSHCRPRSPLMIAARSLLKWFSSLAATVSLTADQVGQLHQIAARAAHVDRSQIARLAALIVFHLHDDVVLLAFVLVARDIAPAEQRFQRMADRLHRIRPARPPCRGRSRTASCGLFSLRSVSRPVMPDTGSASPSSW